MKGITIMALDLTTLAPQKGTGLTRKSAGKEAGPNPFLEEGWLLESYNLNVEHGPDGADYYVTVPGQWEKAVKTRGKSKGQEYMKLTGDAAQVVRMLRDAADKLEIGVAIECVPAYRIVNEGKRNERAEELPGMVRVNYLGKVRKVYADRETADADNGHEDDGPDLGDEPEE